MGAEFLDVLFLFEEGACEYLLRPEGLCLLIQRDVLRIRHCLVGHADILASAHARIHEGVQCEYAMFRGMKSFWQKLPKPFIVQAPMEDVTDAAFRRLIAKYGKPDVMFSEFTSADGLVLAPPAGQRALRKKLLFSEGEHPIVAQLFSAVPARMEKAARIAAELGFDGVDINMGCPDRAVEKSGCGAGLIEHPGLAHELIRAAKRGAATAQHPFRTRRVLNGWKEPIPVSVKTRIGYNTDQLDSWLPELLAESPAAITLHARTRKEMSDVPARWDTVERAVIIRDAAKSSTLIIGNGDVKDIPDARAKAVETKCDGVMLGRAIYGNPWLFSNSRELAHKQYVPTPQERLRALSEHLALFEELLGDTVNYSTMKKHFKAYISGWPARAGRDGAKELRIKLMATQITAEAAKILQVES